jgi:hypothetical protein
LDKKGEKLLSSTLVGFGMKAVEEENCHPLLDEPIAISEIDGQ